MPTPTPIIAIDGPSASGKGTVAKRLAEHYGFAYLDTGILYRMVGMGVLMASRDPSDPVEAEKAAKAFTYENLVRQGNDPIIRGTQAATAASKVAAIPAVRAALLKFQQDFCVTPPDGAGGAVLDGRDIGTVIAPQAVVKIYVTATVEVRAERRLKQVKATGENIIYETVLADLKERDARDSSRAAAPAKPADDAVILDNTVLNAEETYEAALKIALAKLPKG
jgi:cytidylate kinase